MMKRTGLVGLVRFCRSGAFRSSRSALLIAIWSSRRPSVIRYSNASSLCTWLPSRWSLPVGRRRGGALGALDRTLAVARAQRHRVLGCILALHVAAAALVLAGPLRLHQADRPDVACAIGMQAFRIGLQGVELRQRLAQA